MLRAVNELFAQFLASSNDPTLRRAVADRIREALHAVLEVLGPSHAARGLGVGKADDGTFELHATLYLRTKRLPSELDLVLSGFRPDAWPTHGSLQLVFRVCAYAGGTANKGYEYSAQDESTLHALLDVFLREGYRSTEAAKHGFQGATQVTLCERPLDMSPERIFDDDGAAFLAATLSSEHGRLLTAVRSWVRSVGRDAPRTPTKPR
jgi:hypothetical protein